MNLLLINFGINRELSLLLEVQELTLLCLLDVHLIELLSHHLYVSLDQLKGSLEISFAYTLKGFHLIVSGHELFIELCSQSLKLLHHLIMILRCLGMEYIHFSLDFIDIVISLLLSCGGLLFKFCLGFGLFFAEI